MQLLKETCSDMLKHGNWFLVMPIKGIDYCSIQQMGILDWIVVFEEMTWKDLSGFR